MLSFDRIDDASLRELEDGLGLADAGRVVNLANPLLALALA